MKKLAAYLVVISFILSNLFGTAAFAQKESDTANTSQLSTSALADANTKGVVFAPAKELYSYNFTWNALSENAEYLQYTESEKLTNGTMPSKVLSVTAAVESSKRGYTARAYIEGLKENTEYSYRVGSDAAGWSEVYSFKTSSDDGAFSFVLAGDPQIGATATAYDAENWNTTLNNAANWFGDDIEFIMTAGDQVNTNSTHEQYTGFLSSPLMRSLPTVTTVGNHDNGSTHSSYFTYTDVDQTTLSSAGVYGGDYWFIYDGALIMSLNFNNTSVAVHKSFMERAINDFSAYYGEPTWIIAVFHQPIYSQGVRAEQEFTIAQRELLAPVMSELGVDVVLTGHDHVYTRAYMMNGTTVKDDPSLYTPVGDDEYGSIYDPAEGDVFYLTANSASGSKYYSLNSNVMPFTCVSSKENVQTLTKIDVTWDSISFTTYRTSETSEMQDTLDFFAIHRSAEEDYYAPTLNVPPVSYIDSAKALDVMDGITAYDNIDGDLTSSIEVTGTIDLNVPFTLTYRVEDASGNSVEKTREFIPYSMTETIDTDALTWDYIDDGSNPYGDNSDLYTWATSDYDSGAWKQGQGPFSSYKGVLSSHNGYTPKTLLNQYYPEDHENAGANIPHFFLRTTFDLDDPERIDFLSGNLRYDDACNVFINGVKVAGYNTGKITNGLGYSSKTSTNDATLGEFSITDPNYISTLNLKEKGNVIAVALYQTNSTSSDIFFYLTGLKFGVANPVQYVSNYGVTMTLHELDGVKDFFIGKGECSTYREVKDNMVVHVTSLKFGEADKYSYILPEPGKYTVLIRYEDNERNDLFIESEVAVTEPAFSADGLQLFVTNLEGVKVIRTAYGEYFTPGEIKRAEGSRSFSARAICSDPYMIQYRENGSVSVGVVYENGYSVVYHYDIVKKTPTVEQNGNTVTFGALDDLKVLRYAKGSYTASADIKRAEGSIALTSASIVDGKISVSLSAGTYTFCVQYNDESYNYYTITAQ